MPYESFKSTHHVAINGLVQDIRTGHWQYLITIKRDMEEDGIFFPTQETKDTIAPKTKHCISPAALHKGISPCTSRIFTIRRSLQDFKRLYTTLSTQSSGKSTLPPFPMNSLMSYFMGDTQTTLLKKRVELELILVAIEDNNAMSESSAYRDFLTSDAYDQDETVDDQENDDDTILLTSPLQLNLHDRLQSFNSFNFNTQEQTCRKSWDAMDQENEKCVEFRRFTLLG